MNPTMKRLTAAAMAALLTGPTGAALAQVGPAREAATPGTERHTREMKMATEHVNKAVQVVQQMQAAPELRALLQKAQGVFVVPDYGGAGVLLVRSGDTWSSPAFYNMGGISAGLQAGAEAGAIAFVLNDQKALNSFMQNNKFSLGADAGLTVADWSKRGEGSAGWGNITAWADTKGLFGGVALNVTDIDYDEDETSAYYQRQVAARDVLSGKVRNPQADTLRQTLASISGGGAASSMGSSGAAGTTASGKDGKSESERERSR